MGTQQQRNSSQRQAHPTREGLQGLASYDRLESPAASPRIVSSHFAQHTGEHKQESKVTRSTSECIGLWMGLVWKEISSIPNWITKTSSDKFGILVGLAITLNAVVIGFETDMGDELLIFDIFEVGFQIFFTMELSLRIMEVGLKEVLMDPWRLFDAFLVVVGGLDIFILPLVTGNSRGGGLANLRMFRVMRILRVLRLFKVFHELMVILQAFLLSFNAVIWIGVLLLILNYICAVFATQMIGHRADLWDRGDKQTADLCDTGAKEKILDWFGTIGASMQTLFIVMTMDDWGSIARTLKEELPAWLVFLPFCLYILVCSFSMVSLITGVISEALSRAQQEDEVRIKREMEENRASFAIAVKSLFLPKSNDDDGGSKIFSGIAGNIENGCDHIEVTREEFEHLFETFDDEGVSILQKLSYLDIDTNREDLLVLFDKLSQEHVEDKHNDFASMKHDDARYVPKTVPLDTLIHALVHMQGPAKASSVIEIKCIVLNLRKHVKETRSQIRNMRKQLETQKEDLDKRLDFISSHLEILVAGQQQGNVPRQPATSTTSLEGSPLQLETHFEHSSSHQATHHAQNAEPKCGSSEQHTRLLSPPPAPATHAQECWVEAGAFGHQNNAVMSILAESTNLGIESTDIQAAREQQQMGEHHQPATELIEDLNKGYQQLLIQLQSFDGSQTAEADVPEAVEIDIQRQDEEGQEDDGSPATFERVTLPNLCAQEIVRETRMEQAILQEPGQNTRVTEPSNVGMSDHGTSVSLLN